MNVKEIAAQIKTAHKTICSLQKQSLQHAITAGDLLGQVSRAMPQKEFAAWCRKEVGISYETAAAYMRVYKHRDKLPKNLNYTAALNVLRQSRKPKSEVPTKQPDAKPEVPTKKAVKWDFADDATVKVTLIRPDLFKLVMDDTDKECNVNVPVALAKAIVKQLQSELKKNGGLHADTLAA